MDVFVEEVSECGVYHIVNSKHDRGKGQVRSSPLRVIMYSKLYDLCHIELLFRAVESVRGSSYSFFFLFFFMRALAIMSMFQGISAARFRTMVISACVFIPTLAYMLTVERALTSASEFFDWWGKPTKPT
jgi:hypothetical protein